MLYSKQSCEIGFGWRFFSLCDRVFCRYTVNYVRIFGKALLEVQKIKLDESWLAFWGQNSTWLSLIWEKCIIAVAFWQSAQMPGNAPLSRYCFSGLRWICSSMLQCLRTDTRWPSITGKLNCSPMPRCHRVQSAIIFSQTQQLDAGTANQGRQWAG